MYNLRNLILGVWNEVITNSIFFPFVFSFSSNGSGTLSIAKAGKNGQFEILQSLTTQKGVRTMTIDPNTHTAYLLAAKYEEADPKNLN